MVARAFGHRRLVCAVPTDRESGFTLLEVLLATAIFAFVALTGFESARHFVVVANQLLQRQNEDQQLKVTIASLRSDALSASAVWMPASGCGDAVSFMKPDAAGLTFVTYAARNGQLARLTSNDPIDPCDAALTADMMIASLDGFTAIAVSAAQLPGHVDAGSGNADGGLFAVAPRAVNTDAHVADYDGSEISTGNGVVEVTVDAAPARSVVDLAAGIIPTGLTVVLQYPCTVRCAANQSVFPELRGRTVTSCAQGIDFQDNGNYYVPWSFGLVPAGGGKLRIVITSYFVAFRYAFTFSDGSTAYRTWPAAQWPPAANLADPYPFAYGSPNAVNGTNPANIAADLNEPANFNSEIGSCSGLGGDRYYRG